MANQLTACTVLVLMSLTMAAAQAPAPPVSSPSPQSPPSPLSTDAFARLRDFAVRSSANATADAAAVQLLGLQPVTEAKEVVSTHGGDRSVFLVVMKNGAPTGDVVLILQATPGSADEMVHYYLTDPTRQLRSGVTYSRATRATVKTDPDEAARGFQTELRLWSDIAKRVP
jgi:hypothetical protein